MKTLPLFYYPSTWLWIDDDRTLLNTMTEVFNEQNTVKPFQSANECLAFLQSYQSPLSKYSFLKSNSEDENYGLLQRAPMDFDVTLIAKLVDDKARHDEISAMVIDYNMPEMNGFTLAKTMPVMPIQKILLTGNEGSKAIEGFNNNLIQRFVQKGDEDMFDDLSQYLNELSLNYFQQLTLPLLSYLETDAKLPLSDPLFIDFFQEYCKQHHINEYYLIDKQGSFLCIDDKGHRSCLVVHTDRSLDIWLPMYQDENALSDADIRAIKSRQKIPFFGVGIETWETAPSEWSQHLYPANTLEGRETYFWTTIN